MHLIMKKPGYCTVKYVLEWTLVCVQESGLFTYIVHSKQVGTAESLAGVTIIPAIERFVDLSDSCSNLWRTSAIILKAGMYILPNNFPNFKDTNNSKFTA